MNVKALILLGGLGTRLRPLTLRQPKPLLPILNRPLLSYQLELLRRCGIRDVILGLGHKAAHFKRSLGTGARWGMRFRYSIERKPLGTGGAIRFALPNADGPVLILNGDVLSDFDLNALARRHRQAKSQATLALVKVPDPSSFGLVRKDGWGRVQRFIEKPSSGKFWGRTVNAGCYVFEPEVVWRIPVGRAVSIEREIFPALIKEGFRVHGHLHTGYWSDIGTLKTYWRTHADLHERGLWPKGHHSRGGMIVAPGAKIHPTARVRGTAVVGGGAVLGADVVLRGRVTIGPGSRIEEGAQIADAVLLENVRVGPRARVEKSIVGAGARVGADCRVGPDQVLAPVARLPDHTQTLPGLTD